MKYLNRLKEIGRDLTKLSNVIELLHWDQETQLPVNGVSDRAEQIAYLSEILHEKSTTDEIEKIFGKLLGNENKLSVTDNAYIKMFYKDFSRSRKLPTKLISDIAKETSIAQKVWVQARKTDDFDLFAPKLNKIIELLKEKADRLGYDSCNYDPLLDEYEPFMRSEDIRKVFDKLQIGLSEIVKKIKGSKQVDTDFLRQSFSIKKQDKFGRSVINDMGYPMDSGRLDISAHPFTITLGSKDVRITTRYSKDTLFSGLFSNIHEAGHGLYELGFSDEIQGNILATGTSLGIHESQSRMWENQIGRSYEFWQYYYPRLKKTFSEELKDVSLDNFYKAVNKVSSSLIRVEADEVTYNLHIILRFNLEMDLMSGKLQVKDLPEAWDQKMIQYLGIKPDKAGTGVLQDVHWSAGLVGYFPTYALGNIYGVQFFNKMKKDIGDIEAQVSSGNFENILKWLRKNIHSYGSVYSAEELCENITGEKLNPKYFLDYIEKKYSKIYGY